MVTKRRPDGKAVSSITAPWLQAKMIEHAGVRTGHRVLEIRSGGYNAALLAEVVGPTGAVTSIDIDPDVIGCAQRGLAIAGYPQVTAVVGDGEHGHLPNAPYDAIIVTVETSDVPPAWVEQLTPGWGAGRAAADAGDHAKHRLHPRQRGRKGPAGRPVHAHVRVRADAGRGQHPGTAPRPRRR